MATVIVERLSAGSYEEGCVALGKDYGTASWDEREEVAAIRRAVFAALDGLAGRSCLRARIEGRPVLVKPNLVTVYRDMGLLRKSYPETTDPRVLDAAVLWISRLASSVTIVESSGRGVPTRGSFRIAGLDRLARHRGCGLVALDEEPVDRYLLPKAAVHREILAPRIFAGVVRGEAAYVSVPKMKTNLYTQVTLGFKNAMGTIPYNLRQRDHNYDIDRKLVEMLYLFKPDLVLIDGVVGGEGECPAPVDPVDSRMIVAGDHPVETDRVAAALMGFDPAAIALFRVADELGFGEEGAVEVVGDARPVAFRPADASLVSGRVRASFPTVKVLIGIDKGPRGARDGSAEDAMRDISPAAVRALEASCRGGCVASTRFAFSMLEAEGVSLRKDVVLVVGGGAPLWYDAEGKAYDAAGIAALPGRKMVVGSCSKAIAHLADRYVQGCMPLPNAPHAVLHELGGRPCKVTSLANPNLLPLLGDILSQRRARRRLLAEGRRLDVPLRPDGGGSELPEAGPAEAGRDWVELPLPPLGPREARELQGLEDDAAIANFRGVLVLRVKEKALWIVQAIVAGTVTMSPLALAAASLAARRPLAGLSAGGWLGLFGAIELLHCLELLPALRAARRFRERKGGVWDARAKARAVAGTLLLGYPSWVPKRTGAFD